MVNLRKTCFENIRDLAYVMRKPFEKIKFLYPKEMIEKIIEGKQKITVHLYPIKFERKESCLLDLTRWSYHQIYISIFNDQIFWSMGNGNTSWFRESHNALIDLVISNNLIKEIPTAILVTFSGKIVSYYFHENFSYVNHDIGSNYDKSIIEKVKQIKCFSYRNFNFKEMEIWFKAKKEKLLIFRSFCKDIMSRKIEERLKKVKNE